MPPTDGSSPPDESSTQTPEETVADRSTPPQADDGGHGDYNRVTESNELQTITGEEISVPVDELWQVIQTFLFMYTSNMCYVTVLNIFK